MLKNIFKIYIEDLKRIFTNYAAFVVILALCILPSLYAWFNIKASWDPYSQEATSQIKIGVVNNDEGTILNGEAVNIGDQVIEELKKNDLMGWQFVSEEEAEKALDEGTYYATLTIPGSFSNDLTSLVTNDVHKGQIIYRVNEKINAIAPKLTSKGATGVQESVNETVIKTVSSVLLETGKSLGLEIQDTLLPKLASVANSLNELTTKFGLINETVAKANDGGLKLKDLISQIQSDLPKIQETLTSAQTLTSSIETFISTSQGSINDLFPTVKADVQLVTDITAEMMKYVDGLKQAIESGSAEAPTTIQNLITKVNSGENLVESLVKLLESFNKISFGKPLTGIIEQLNGIKTELVNISNFLQTLFDEVVNSGEPDLTLLSKVQTVLQDVQTISSDLVNHFDDKVAAPLNSILDEAYKTSQNVLTVLKDAEAKLPQVSELLNVAYEGADTGIEAIQYVNEKLPQAENIIAELAGKVTDINNSQELKDVLELLQSAVQEREDFLSNPVELVEETVFPMHNYGTAMTPFYSVLAIWVGMTLLVSMLSVKAKGDYHPIEEYFGKFLLFVSISLVQALIIALGDLYILKIYCMNSGLFIVSLLFTAVTFTFIVYSLVSVLGNVGKVASIILLVLQVAGSGGTFPIQLTPKFFQMINPFLPFTYSISMAREAIGGVVQTVLTKDIVILLIFISAAILVAIFLKKPLNKLLSGFAEKYEESGLGE
ncbi:YhgE/Pip domain-containing protein [Turicibacter sanguinis]|nr:YhgE/Pip domain-containing protein [Turicibacter sanguinis]